MEKKKRNCSVLKLRLELNTEGADMAVLQKYGKVQEGIIRDILVPADMTLHALHYVIQKAFGWRGGHLHHFELPDELFSELTQNNFMRWGEYCGIYFRFPVQDREQNCWEDFYDGSVSEKTWLRRKYTGPYFYPEPSERFLKIKSALNAFIKKHRTVEVFPPFSEIVDLSEEEMQRLMSNPKTVNLEDATCEEMGILLFEGGGLVELLERLSVSDILGKRATAAELADVTEEADQQAADRKKRSVSGWKALPLTDELVYEYDYGDGWEVRIRLLDGYYSESAGGDNPDAGAGENTADAQTWLSLNGETVTEELRSQIAAVVAGYRPLCTYADGLPVLDDVGGISGYCEMLSCIHRKGSGDPDGDDPAETREWARDQGWTGRMGAPEKML